MFSISSILVNIIPKNHLTRLKFRKLKIIIRGWWNSHTFVFFCSKIIRKLIECFFQWVHWNYTSTSIEPRTTLYNSLQLFSTCIAQADSNSTSSVMLNRSWTVRVLSHLNILLLSNSVHSQRLWANSWAMLISISS